jgi:hypothetical protein
METAMSGGRVLAGIYLCAFACITGCGIREHHSIDELDIQPSVLDLGTVAVTGQQVSAKFTLKNNGSKKVDVQLTSACSCVIAGSPSATLGPQQPVERIAYSYHVYRIEPLPADPQAPIQEPMQE